MHLYELLDIYDLLSRGNKGLSVRKHALKIRKSELLTIDNNGLIKVAFDTRRINQETDFIPRRGLQNYHRSDKFVSDNMSIKITAFSKLQRVLTELKSEFGREPEWQDSYSRILLSALDKGLRTIQKDGDFSDCQSAVGSFDYLEELAYVRYRLNMDNLNKMSETELKKVLLDKDELLVSRGNFISNEYSSNDIMKNSYDNLVDKMLSTMAQVMSTFKPPVQEDSLTKQLFDLKATSENKDVERVVTIHIKDKINSEIEKKSEEKSIEKKVAIEDQDNIILE